MDRYPALKKRMGWYYVKARLTKLSWSMPIHIVGVGGVWCFNSAVYEGAGWDMLPLLCFLFVVMLIVRSAAFHTPVIDNLIVSVSKLMYPLVVLTIVLVACKLHEVSL